MHAAEQLAALDKEALVDRHLRLVADHRRMVQKSGEDTVRAKRDEKRRLLLNFLDLLDDAERGLATLPDEAGPWREGLDTLRRRLEHTFHEEGVRRMDVLHTPFDPTRHEAVAVDAYSPLPDGTVTQEVRPGYSLDGEVLRPARVVVARRA